MDTRIDILGWNFAAIVVMMVCGWLISLRFKNVTIVDSLWGLGFVMVAWVTFTLTSSINTQFEGRKPVVLVINNILYAITYTLYGGIIAIWH